MPSLCACISGHGFGHLAQSAAVLNTLFNTPAKMSLTVRSELPQETISSWLEMPFTYVHATDDIGMIMRDALNVDMGASAAAYSRLHKDWSNSVREIGLDLQVAGVSLVLADVPYLPLAAAQSVGIPSIGMCSLNWADVLECYFPEHRDWVETSRQAYASTDTFLIPEPGMKMPWLSHQRRIGPIARTGHNRRDQLMAAAAIPEDTWLILIGMGGIHHPLDLRGWPSKIDGHAVHYFAPGQLAGQIAHATAAAEIPYSYADVIASCDLVVTKPGYGMFVEAAGAGVPVLYSSRDRWPDVVSLTTWLRTVANALQVDSEKLEAGLIGDEMSHLLKAGRYEPALLSGATEAADIIKTFID